MKAARVNISLPCLYISTSKSCGSYLYLWYLFLYLSITYSCDDLPAAAAANIKELWDTTKAPVKEVEGCRLSELCCSPKPTITKFKTTPDIDAINFELLLAGNLPHSKIVSTNTIRNYHTFSAAPNSVLAMHVKNYRRTTRDPLESITQSGSSNNKNN